MRQKFFDKLKKTTNEHEYTQIFIERKISLIIGVHSCSFVVFFFVFFVVKIIKLNTNDIDVAIF